MKQKLEEKNEDNKNKKKKKAYISWKDNTSSISSDSCESIEEETNFCLMVGYTLPESSVSNFEATSIENKYYHLLDVFQELYEKARKLQY